MRRHLLFAAALLLGGVTLTACTSGTSHAPAPSAASSSTRPLGGFGSALVTPEPGTPSAGTTSVVTTPPAIVTLPASVVTTKVAVVQPAPAKTTTAPKTTAAPAAVGPKVYANCAALNVDYPHGVGRAGAVDHVSSGTPVTNFTVDDAVYDANPGRDGDGDGIACEKH